MVEIQWNRFGLTGLTATAGEAKKVKASAVGKACYVRGRHSSLHCMIYGGQPFYTNISISRLVLYD